MQDRGTWVQACRIPEKTLLSDLGAALKGIPSDRLNRILRYKFEADSVRSALGELMVRRHLASLLNRTPDSIKINIQEYGKPYLEDHPGIHFNISHAGDWVAAGFSPEKIGVDIEKLGDVDWYTAESCFSEEEQRYIAHPDPEISQKRFFEIWTLRESFIKSEGPGFSFGMENFSVEKIGSGRFKVKPESRWRNYRLWTEQLDHRHIISAASAGGKEEPPQLDILNFRDIQVL